MARGAGVAGLGAVLVLCLLALDPVARAQAPPTLPPQSPDPLAQLRQDITAATAAQGVERAVWGVVVHSLDRNERLFELNPRTLLVPASTVKLVSVASAAEAVGWDFRFETTIRATAPVIGGTLRGDLIIVGSGDPSIAGPGGQPLSVWIDALKAIGLRRVVGRVIGDDDAVEEPRPQLAWAWDDLGYHTGALFGALNLGENRTFVTIAPGASTEAAPMLSVEPFAAARPLRNRTVTGPRGSRQLLWPEQRPGEPFLTIAGSIPVGARPARLTISVGNPTAWFAAAFRSALIAGGIDVTGQAYDVDDVGALPGREDSMAILSHRSPTLAEIAQPTLKDSINLYGEAALRLNAAPGALPTNDAALEGLQKRLAAWGIAPEAWQIVDGSGLSRRNAVAPEVLVTLLERMHDPSGTSPWMTALPVAGRDGTLAERMKGTPAENNVRAKTGTMTNVRTLAGYVRTRDGETLAFAIMANGFEGTGTAANRALDRIATRLAAFSRVTN